jgi:hypothetical protein
MSTFEMGERSIEVFELIQLAQIYEKPARLPITPESCVRNYIHVKGNNGERPFRLGFYYLASQARPMLSLAA